MNTSTLSKADIERTRNESAQKLSEHQLECEKRYGELKASASVVSNDLGYLKKKVSALSENVKKIGELQIRNDVHTARTYKIMLTILGLTVSALFAQFMNVFL